ncbi:MAG: putative sulfate exporter family transporter [Anaerolineales bacterium]
MIAFVQSIYGVGLCILIGVVAVLLSPYISIGSVSLAIILGMLVSNLFKPGKVFKAGIHFSEKHILALAIALMGVNLNFLILRELSYKTILLIMTAIAVTIFSAIVIAKIFKFSEKFALLLGIGSGVCGSSAIAATEQIIGAKEEEVGLSIAIVNFLGTLGIFLLPIIGSAIFRFSDINTGILIGNTLQAVGQVTAAGFSVSEVTGQTATIVKMGRILMLTPIILIFIFSNRIFGNVLENNQTRPRGIPLFIVGFVVFSLVPTLGLVSVDTIEMLSATSKNALIIAMAGVGLKITFSNLLREGKEALKVGFLIFGMQIIFSTSMVYILFH